MAVSAAPVTVATTATLLSGTDSGYGGTGAHPDGMSVLVKVPTGGSTVYVGASDVTTATGYPVAAGEAIAFDLGKNDALYGRVASGTQAVNVLRTGV